MMAVGIAAGRRGDRSAPTLPAASLGRGHPTAGKEASLLAETFTAGAAKKLRKASVGQTIELASVGPFTFYGRCTDAGGPNREAEAFVATSAPKSFMESSVKAFTEPDFEPGVEAKIGNSYSYDFPLWVSGIGSEFEWTAASPDGSTLLRGNVSWGVFVFGAACAYQLSWRNEA